MEQLCAYISSIDILFYILRVPFHFGEQGNYSLWVKNLNDSAVVSCSIVTDAEPVNSYIRESHAHTHIHKLVRRVDVKCSPLLSFTEYTLLYI